MKSTAAAVAIWGLVSCGTAIAQNPTGGDPRPTIRTSATEVLLDMAVFDRHGKPVKNLKAGDVEIYEDDVRQQITSFRFIPVTEARREQHATSAKGAAPGQTASRPLRAVNLVCLVFHNLDPLGRTRATEIAREFLKNELPPDTYIGMFLLDDRLTPIHPFTNNRQELAEAVGKAFTLRPLDLGVASEPVLTANPTQATIAVVVDTATHTATVTQQITGGEVASTVFAGAEVSNDAGANAIRGTRVTEARDFSNISGMRETDKIINLVTQFGKLPGRKLVLLLSSGFTTTGDPELFQSILAKANDSRTTVYAIDVAGLTQNSTAQAADLAVGQVASVSRTQTAIGGTLSQAKEKSRQNDTMNDAVRASDPQASLRALAEGTGGFLVANTNEFQKPFQRIAEDLETHYEVTYRASGGKFDGRLRNIRIKLAHPDWRVESRTGYFAMPALGNAGGLQPYETMGLAVLDSKPLPHAFDFRSTVFHFRPTAEGHDSALVIEIPGTSLAATANAARHTHVLHGQVLALIRDADQQIVDKFSLDAPYEIADDKLAALAGTPFVYTHALDLPAGRYTAETLVMDREGKRASVNAAPFEIAGEGAGIGMSSALLIRRIEEAGGGPPASGPLTLRGRRLVPFVETSLTLDNKPYAYFVVYPDPFNPAKPRVQVEFQVDGQSLANQTVDLPAPDASGAIPMMIRANVHTGRCELKITTMQGEQKATRTLAYTVAAK